MSNDMMSLEAEEATRQEWLDAMAAMREMRKGAGQGNLIGAIYEYGRVCYLAGLAEAAKLRVEKCSVFSYGPKVNS